MSDSVSVKRYRFLGITWWKIVRSDYYVKKYLLGVLVYKRLKVDKSIEEIQIIESDFKRKFDAFCKFSSHESQIKKIFIYLSIPFKAELYQRPQHLAVNLARLNNLVIYADNKQAGEISENLHILGEKLIFKVAKPLGKSIYVFVGNTIDINTTLRLKQEGYEIIYEYIDEISDEIFGGAASFLREKHRRLEEAEPSLIITTAKKLYEEMAARFGEEKVILSPNAVDVEHFNNVDKSVIPDDLIEITRKDQSIIGYYGAIAPWLDYELINRAAKERPDYNFVFIGPNYDNEWAKEFKQTNIKYLGAKHYSELPQYSIHFDVCMIPFKEGEVAKLTSPLKLFEYMAAKKAVVVTKDLLECYGYEGVLPSQNDEEFITNLDKALMLGKDVNIQNKLFSYARENTWKQRAVAIDKRISEIEKETLFRG